MYLQHLYPNPVSLNYGEENFCFGTEVVMETDADLSIDESKRLQALLYQFTCTASQLKISESKTKRAGEVHAVLKRKEPFSDVRNRVLEKGWQYSIDITSDNIYISAEDKKALFYAFTTLLQMVIPKSLKEGEELFYIREGTVKDKAATAFRGLHLCVFPETPPSLLKKAVRMAGFLKFTHIILEFWGTFPYRCCPEMAWKDRAYSRDTIIELVSEIRSFGMEVVPMINHLGHASQSRIGMGRHTVLDQAPRYGLLFEPDGWTWCITNPDTWKLLSELREELIEICGNGQYFHLGFDEAYSYATCQKCSEGKDEARLLAEYINRLTEDLAKKGRRPIIWHDELISSKDWPEKTVANGDRLHQTADALDWIDKRVILADWQYDLTSGDMPTSKYFMEKGFDVILCPWDNAENMNCLCNSTKQLGAMGTLFTTWDTLPGCIPLMPGMSSMAWEEKLRDKAPVIPRTEAAAILRKLTTDLSGYENAGWLRAEVDE